MHSAIYATLYVPQGAAQIGNDYTHTHTYIYAQVYMHIQGSPDEIRIPTRWNVIGRSMCYRPAVFIRQIRLSALLNEVIIQPFILLKLPTSEYA